MGCLSLIRQCFMCRYECTINQCCAHTHMLTHTHLLVQCMELSVPPEHHPVVIVSENIHLVHLQQAQSDTHTHTHTHTHTRGAAAARAVHNTPRSPCREKGQNESLSL